MKRRKKAPTMHSAWSYAIILIDDKPIRKKALKSFTSAEKSLHKARTQFEHFQNQDFPAYTRWESENFGPLLAELQQLEAQISEKVNILSAIEDEVFWHNCSYVTAYKRVMKEIRFMEEEQKRAAENSHEESTHTNESFPFDEDENFFQESEDVYLYGSSHLPPGFDIKDYETWSKQRKTHFAREYESLAAMYHLFTGRPRPILEDILNEERVRWGLPPKHNPNHTRSSIETTLTREPSPDERIRTLYRKLARQLHPDSTANYSWLEKELWHEVQAAYQARDLERLEVAAGRADIYFNGASPNLPVHILLRMTKDLHSKLREARRNLRNAQSQKAWNFSTRTPSELESLRQDRATSIEYTRGSLTSELTSFTAKLDALAQQAARPKAARRPKTASSNKKQQPQAAASVPIKKVHKKPSKETADVPEQMAFF